MHSTYYNNYNNNKFININILFYIQAVKTAVDEAGKLNSLFKLRNVQLRKFSVEVKYAFRAIEIHKLKTFKRLRRQTMHACSFLVLKNQWQIQAILPSEYVK